METHHLRRLGHPGCLKPPPAARDIVEVTWQRARLTAMIEHKGAATTPSESFQAGPSLLRVSLNGVIELQVVRTDPEFLDFALAPSPLAQYLKDCAANFLGLYVEQDLPVGNDCFDGRSVAS